MHNTLIICLNDRSPLHLHGVGGCRHGCKFVCYATMCKRPWLSGFPMNPMNKRQHESALSMVDSFSKWAILISVDTSMGTEALCDVVWSKVSSWTDLPPSILGDRGTRVRAQQMRDISKYLGSRLISSATCHHRQMDKQRMPARPYYCAIIIVLRAYQGTLQQTALRAYVNRYHSDWE
jgi:hypothetical protein